MNLYGFVQNRSIGSVDLLGLVEVVGAVPKVKDISVVWVNKPRNQNPGYTFSRGSVFCICGGKPPQIRCHFNAEIIISLNAGAKLRDKDAAGYPETFERVFGHEVLRAKETIRLLQKVVDELEAEPDDPVTKKRAAELTETYQKKIDQALKDGRKHDDTKVGNPKDPRPRTGVGYPPPKGGPKLPPNPFKN